MIPNQTRYPDFVPDQLLTSANLNDLFAYLDEQGRMTRTNLLGIGIVCGLEVRTSADGTSIEITKGTGVTSEGHLVAFDGDLATRTFGHRVAFDPEKEAYYDKFLDASHHKKFDLWELKRTAAGEGEVALTKTFLEGEGVPNHRKVVLAFVELLEEQNKNCNPESCDDKGVTVHVKDQKTDKSAKYRIVGSAEASPAEQKLSNESPVGKALIGHKKGDLVRASVPRGEVELKILAVR